MKKFSIYVLAILFISNFLLVESCSKDDKPKACANFPSLNEEMTFNGKTQTLSSAQRVVVDGTVLMQLSSFSSDCNELWSVSFNYSPASTTNISGTYSVTSFLDYIGVNDTYGSVIYQKISPITQSLVDLASGTLIIEDLGSNKIKIDLNAKDATGATVSLKITHQF